MLGASRLRGWGRTEPVTKARDVSIAVLVDWFYRAPAVAGIQAVLVFVALGTVRTPGSVSEGCHPSAALGGDSSWLAPAASATAVVLSSATVALFLLGVAFRLGEPKRVAGQVRNPSKPLKRGESAPPLPSPVLLPLVAASVILSYASLYLALAAIEPSTFHAIPCSLDPFSSVYFSTVVSATVGFGDIAPMKDGARLIVVAQMFFAVTFFAIFVAELFRDSSGSGEGFPDRSRAGGSSLPWRGRAARARSRYRAR
jgi:hypothetical protein